MVRILKNFSYASLAVALFIIGLNRFLVFSPNILDIWASNALYHAINFQNYLTAPYSKWASNKKSLQELQQNLNILTNENENLRAQIIELKASQNFANSTSELIEFSKNYSLKSILAQVILKNFDDNQHFFLIDAGLNKNITPDMIVVYKNCIVGRISEVYQYYSRVVLITDKTCKVAAYCVNSNVAGIHEGANKTDISSLGYVNHLQTICDKDLILSSGEGLIFPRSFALGTIKKYFQDGLNYNIEVTPMLNFKDLEFCYVVQKGVILDSAAIEKQVEFKIPEFNETKKIKKNKEAKVLPKNNIAEVSIQIQESPKVGQPQDTTSNTVNTEVAKTSIVAETNNIISEVSSQIVETKSEATKV